MSNNGAASNWPSFLSQNCWRYPAQGHLRFRVPTACYSRWSEHPPMQLPLGDRIQVQKVAVRLGPKCRRENRGGNDLLWLSK
jgi:hypothetical protein